MAIEPKSPRKRAVKKIRGKAKAEEVAADNSQAEVTEVADAPKRGKKTAAIPVPIFQAAEVVAPKSRKPVEEKISADSESDSDDSGFESAREEEEDYFDASEEPDLGGTRALRKIGERTARGYKQRIREEIGGIRDLRKIGEAAARRHRLITGEEQKLALEEERKEPPRMSQTQPSSRTQPSGRKRLLKNLGAAALLAGAGMTNIPQTQSTNVVPFSAQSRAPNPFLTSQQTVNPYMARPQNWYETNRGRDLEIAQQIQNRLGGNSTMDRNVLAEVQRRTQEDILKLRTARDEEERRRQEEMFDFRKQRTITL